MSQFAILVTIKLAPGKAEEFKPIILANAESAVRDEPNCHQFQVLQSRDDPDTFYFYEVYSNPEDLDSHRQQPHYKRFAEAASALIVKRSIAPANLINPGNIA